MERMGPRTAGLRGAGPGEDLGLTGISEGSGGPIQQFDGIDWSAAAPSWASLITGVVLPFFAAVALVILIDVALCWLFQRWSDHSWTVAPWLLSIVMTPFALISAFFLGKLFLQLNRLRQNH